MLQLMRGIIHPWAIVDFTWALPQSLLGLIYSLISLVAGARIASVPGHCCIVAENPLMPDYSGISLGPFLLGGAGFRSWVHEYGHTYQSRILGPFYLIVIGVPSFLSALLRPSRHSELYAERWANALAPTGELAHRINAIRTTV
ncbi:MAG: hypothetical protein CMF59_00735 [Leptospiraceae bacterium]|nr:hypothetical protein [Leptospiraceae bacterium]